jgi:hypothetical protein
VSKLEAAPKLRICTLIRTFVTHLLVHIHPKKKITPNRKLGSIVSKTSEIYSLIQVDVIRSLPKMDLRIELIPTISPCVDIQVAYPACSYIYQNPVYS